MNACPGVFALFRELVPGYAAEIDYRWPRKV
jgi:hypothetical protein